MTDKQWANYETKTFTGYDTDQTMLRMSAMNLMLHSITNPDIDYKDSLSKQNTVSSKYTVCLANPPFKGSVDAESINDNLKAVTNTKKTELLFIMLKKTETNTPVSVGTRLHLVFTLAMILWQVKTLYIPATIGCLVFGKLCL